MAIDAASLAWIWYATAVSIGVTVAAWACGAVAQTRRWPTRWVWLAAIAVSALWPLLALVVRRPSGATTIALAAASPVGLDVAHAFVAMWALVSVLLLLRVAVAFAIVRWRTQDWPRTTSDGVRVLRSPRSGPAVIGISRPSIVLPSWVDSLSVGDRARVVAHEREHLRAGDHVLGLMATLMSALFPWNIGLWYQGYRLRLSIEMDCDARVLRQHPNVEAYGRLLVDCARVSMGLGIVKATTTMLRGAAGELSHRLRAMTAIAPAPWVCRSQLAACAVAVACAGLFLRHVPLPPPVRWELATPRLLPVPHGTPIAVPSIEEDDRFVTVGADGLVTRVSGPPLRASETAALRAVHGPAMVQFTRDPDRPSATVVLVRYRRG